MDLQKYEELTGITVAPNRVAKVNAVIRRTKSQLETMLGFTLKPKNLYTEKGKVQFEGYIPLISDINNLDSLNLLPPDEENGMYKLFPYNETDKFFHVDPFKNMYRVKLVIPVPNGEFITLVQLDNVVASYGRDNIGKYIERHYEWFTWAWYRTYLHSWNANGADGMMLAVDADWINCYPDDLMYLWSDMISYYTDPNYSITGNLRSESVDGHSWSKGNPNGSKADSQAPQDSTEGRLLLTRYAGPFGSIVRNPVR